MSPTHTSARIISDHEAWQIMHEFRLDYATGVFDNAPEKLRTMQGVFPRKNGKYFYEVLETAQIDELSVGLALNMFGEATKTSLKTKHPDVRWESFTSQSFLDAIEEAEMDEDENIKETVRSLKGVDVSDPAWNALAQKKYGGRAIGLFLKLAAEMAASDDEE